MKHLSKEAIEGKRVILRLDLNVPVHEGKITDRTRIELAKETLEFCFKYASKVIIISHFGRPDAQRIASLSLQFLVLELRELLKTSIAFAHDIDSLSMNEKIILLENIRYLPGEESDDEELARSIAAYGDVYINEAFSCAHRNHASNHAITKFLPAYPGFALEREVQMLSSLLGDSGKSTVAIIAGKKVSTKFKVLTHLAEKCSHIIVGGAMANTFLAADGHDMKASYVEITFLQQASEFLKNNRSKVLLPTDLVCLNGESVATKRVDQLADGDIAFDIGTESIEMFKRTIDASDRVLWNGPLGYYEDARFNDASLAIAGYISANNKESLVGGGDTIAALASGDFHFTYVSSAGGALLEYLEGVEFETLASLKISSQSRSATL